MHWELLAGINLTPKIATRGAGGLPAKRWKEVTEECTAQMLKDFSDLRVISNLSDLAPTEQAIASRVSSDGDFHYMRLARNGQWYHKMGGASFIDRCSTKEVLDPNKKWVCCYDGPIVLFAKPVDRKVNPI